MKLDMDLTLKYTVWDSSAGTSQGFCHLMDLFYLATMLSGLLNRDNLKSTFLECCFVRI